MVQKGKSLGPGGQPVNASKKQSAGVAGGAAEEKPGKPKDLVDEFFEGVDEDGNLILPP